MVSDKAIFIVPGYRQSAHSQAYKKLAQIFRGEGYKSVPVKITWAGNTISDNTEEFIKKYKSIKAKKKFVLGYSYGAMIAFIAANKISTDGLVLCSLSPYFNEDLKNKKTKARSRLEKKRFNDFLKLKSVDLAKKLKTKKLLMLYGKQEAKTLIKRVNETFDIVNISKKYLLPVKNTEHNIADKKYIYKIREASQILE